jgi:hypothetical protein
LLRVISRSLLTGTDNISGSRSLLLNETAIVLGPASGRHGIDLGTSNDVCFAHVHRPFSMNLASGRCSTLPGTPAS